MQLIELFLLILISCAEFVKPLRSNLGFGVGFLQDADLLLQIFVLFAGATSDQIPKSAVDAQRHHRENTQTQVPGNVVYVSNFHDFFLSLLKAKFSRQLVLGNVIRRSRVSALVLWRSARGVIALY